MEYRNARWANEDQTLIDAEVNHPSFGWIPTTLSAEDAATAEAFTLLSSGYVQAFSPAENGPIPSLTFPQLLIGLVAEGWITEAEGEDWLSGTLPASVLSVIAQLPPEQRFAAKARTLRPTIIDPSERLVGMLVDQEGKTPEDMDAFFRTYAQV